MQRKNNFLRYSHLKSRSGMALIMAIIVVVILATIMALSLSLTTSSTKRTTDVYLHEQVVLYSKSAAELALLEIAKNGCQNTFNTNFPDPVTGIPCIYDANITMKYIYTSATTNVAGVTCDEYISYITTDEQSGSVLMDITVTTTAGTEPIRYFRRSIQKL